MYPSLSLPKEIRMIACTPRTTFHPRANPQMNPIHRKNNGRPGDVVSSRWT